jgi:hypothetical protein
MQARTSPLAIRYNIFFERLFKVLLHFIMRRMSFEMYAAANAEITEVATTPIKMEE